MKNQVSSQNNPIFILESIKGTVYVISSDMSNFQRYPLHLDLRMKEGNISVHFIRTVKYCSFPFNVMHKA